MEIRTFFVNGTSKKALTGKDDKLTFSEIGWLAFPVELGVGDLTIKYFNGIAQSEGQLMPGESVKIRDGMFFEVTSA